MKKFMKTLNENFQIKRSELEESSSTSENYYDLLHESFEEDATVITNNVEEELINVKGFDVDLNQLPDVDIDCMTIADLLEAMHDNISEEQMDEELKLFKKIARIFDMKVYDEIIVCVDDGEYNPQYVLSDGQPVQNMSNIKYYPEAKLVCEARNGLLYLYFATEESCKNYFKLAKRFLTDYELDEPGFNSSEYEVGDVVNIEEALSHRDANNYNKYNLLNKYLSEQFSGKEKYTIAKMLKEGVSDEELHNYMQQLRNDEEALKNYYGVDDEVEADDFVELEENMLNEDYQRENIAKDVEENIDDNFDWFKDEE